MKCKQLTELAATDEQAAAVIIFWMDGYLSGVSGDTTFDEGIINDFAEKIMGACAASPKTGILKMARTVGLE
jgi:acid stress chaperone HdeB